MDESKLKIRINAHEFEAEGDGEWILKQFEMFRQVIAPELFSRPEETKRAELPQVRPPLPLHRLFLVGGQIIALSVAAQPEDAVLLVLLGQKQYLKNESVSGGQIMDGLRQSAIRVRRADTIIIRHADRGDIIMTGKRRNLRYRLSAAGMERAEQIARSLISRLPPPETSQQPSTADAAQPSASSTSTQA